MPHKNKGDHFTKILRRRIMNAERKFRYWLEVEKEMNASDMRDVFNAQAQAELVRVKEMREILKEYETWKGYA